MNSKFNRINTKKDNRNVIKVDTTNNSFVKKKIPKNKDLVTQKQNELNTLPFNPNNRYLDKDFVIELLKKYGIDYGNEYTIKNFDLFQTAFIHDSYSTENYIENNSKLNIHNIPIEFKNNSYYNKLDNQVKKALGSLVYSNIITKDYDISKLIPLQNKNYERLEFLGDSHLGSIISTYLFNRYDDQDQGFMTKLKTNLVNGEQLCNIANKLGMNKYLIISYYCEESGDRNSQAILEDSFEAFIGALYLDMGIEKYHILEKFIINIFESIVDFSEIIQNDVNYKGQILEYYHSQFGVYPLYKLISIVEKNGKKYYKVGVGIQNKETKELIIHSTGEDIKKKKAEQMASKQALIKFGIISE